MRYYFFFVSLTIVTKIDLKLNMEAFDERTASDAKLKNDLLSYFKKESSNTFNILNNMVLNNDYAGVSNELHKLKGNVGIFGFDNIADYIVMIEKKLKSGENADYFGMILELSRSVNEHIVELEKNILIN